jgi:hypothetical protein
LIKDNTEREFVAHLTGNISVSLLVSVSGSECNDLDIIFLGEVLDSIGITEFSDSWLVLLLEELDHGVSLTCLIVLSWASTVVAEKLDSRETLDIKAGAQIAVSILGTVDLGEFDVIITLSKSISSLVVFWSKSLAVSTPWGVELNKSQFMLGNSLIKVLTREDENILERERQRETERRRRRRRRSHAKRKKKQKTHTILKTKKLKYSIEEKKIKK